MRVVVPALVGSTNAQVEFTYRHSDPWAVEIQVLQKSGQLVGLPWRFGRDLLHNGLDEKVGLGDVQVAPEGKSLFLTLAAPTGYLVIVFDRNNIVDVLDSIFLTVPLGAESRHVNWDCELRALGVAQ
jgi:hypothetical protein